MPTANECLRELSLADLKGLIVFMAMFCILGLGQEPAMR